MKFKTLIWGASSKSLIALNMIKDGSAYFGKKKIKDIKLICLVDPSLKKINLDSNAIFINNKKQFYKILKKTNSFIVCIGGSHGKARTLISEELIKRKLNPISLISPYSYIDKTSLLGKGVQIMPNAVVHCYSDIGDYTIINTSSTIDHECKIGRGVHIMGGASIAGRVTIQNYATIGTNATILPNLKISEGAYVGAGAVVTKNVKKNEIVLGNPAKFIKKNIHKCNKYFLK
jgi:acetyltransferase-like isoleucine patch superfamily enzyme